MSESIERKRLFVHLAEGAEILASRVMPNPHRHAMQVRGDVWEVETAQVQQLVDEKLIAGKPVDALWDSIVFRAVDAPRIRAIALAYFERGWGYCPHCGDLLGPPKNQATMIAPRHGFTWGIEDGKRIQTAACEGSGKPLTAPVLPTGTAHAAA